MKQHLFIIAMLLCVGMASNAQETKGHAETTFVEMPGTCTYSSYIPYEKVVISKVGVAGEKERKVKKLSVMGFNPFIHKICVTAPNGDSVKVDKTIQKYWKNMSSLKNGYFKGCKGDTLWFGASKENVAKMDSVIAAFKEESAKKLYRKSFYSIMGLNPYTGETLLGFSGDRYDMMLHSSVQAAVGEGMNEYAEDVFVKMATKGAYNSLDEFKQALEAKDPDAFSFASKPPFLSRRNNK